MSAHAGHAAAAALPAPYSFPKSARASVDPFLLSPNPFQPPQIPSLSLKSLPAPSDSFPFKPLPLTDLFPPSSTLSFFLNCPPDRTSPDALSSILLLKSLAFAFAFAFLSSQTVRPSSQTDVCLKLSVRGHKLVVGPSVA